MTRNKPKFATVGDMPSEYSLCTGSREFEALCLMQGVKSDYTSGFVLAQDGEIVELWGYSGDIAYNVKRVECVYDSWIGKRNEAIRHAYYAMGELHKTARYPKSVDTFYARILSWLEVNRPNCLITDIGSMCAACAFSFRWVKVSALHWHDIDRESLWLER